jgi:hypothetical protein
LPLAMPESAGSGEAVVPMPPATPPSLPDRLQEVIKLAQSGVGDEVILAYVQNSPTGFNPTPDQVLYLTDLGISDVIVTALVNHGTETPPSTPLPTVDPASLAVQEPAPPLAEPVPAEVTYNPEPPLVYAAPPEVGYVTPPPVEDDSFYSSLAPYGSWMDVPDYGWCWQPTVVVLNAGWRPYCDRGRWLNTDCGWYWQSDYSWGWAPFHYGRWFHHPRRGWCWRPDSAWAPAWVAWRYTDNHCGWAPLPPGAHYRAGAGFTYYGASVGVSFGFGLHRDAWTFVPAQHFHDHEIWKYRLAPSEQVAVYRQSRILNDYSVRDHAIVNRGVSDHIPVLARNEPHKIVIRDLPERTGNIRPDRLRQDGTETVLYRPKAPTLDPRAGAAAGNVTRTIQSQPVSPAAPRTPGSGFRSLNSSVGVSPAGTERIANVRPTTIEPNRMVTPYQAPSPAPGRQEVSRPAAPVSAERSTGTAPSYQIPVRQSPYSPAPAQSRPMPSTTAPAPESRPAPSYAPSMVSRPVNPAYSAPAEGGPTPAAPARSPSFTAPTTESRSQVPYSPPPTMTRPAPSYAAPPVQSRPAPSYSPAPVQSRAAAPAPAYSAPAPRAAQPSGSGGAVNRRQN